MTQTKPFFGTAEPAWEIAQLFPAQGEWTEGSYTVHGVFSVGEQATSRLLAGFAVDVAALFTEAEE